MQERRVESVLPRGPAQAGPVLGCQAAVRLHMLLQSGMLHYMLRQLHAYYMTLHAFTVDSMQLQALHASSVGPSYFNHAVTGITC